MPRRLIVQFMADGQTIADLREAPGIVAPDAPAPCDPSSVGRLAKKLGLRIGDQTEFDIRRADIAADGCCRPVVRSCRNRNVSLTCQHSRRHVETDPSRTRQIDLGPRVQIRKVSFNLARPLKRIDVGTAIMAAPCTYEVDGVQYVAVMAGFGGGGAGGRVLAGRGGPAGERGGGEECGGDSHLRGKALFADGLPPKT